MDNQYLYTFFNNNKIVMKDITFSGITGSNNPQTPMIHINDFPTASVEISGVYVENCNFLNSAFIRNPAPINSVSIKDVYMVNTTVALGQSIMTFESINRIEIYNHTYHQIRNTDSSSEGGAIIRITSINMENEDTETLISDISVSQSSVSLLLLDSLTGTPPVPKLISMKNIDFSDMHIFSETSLLSTQGFFYEFDITFEYSNLTFNNITFENHGDLMNLRHYLPNPVIVRDSTFTNVKSAGIKIGSSTTQNANYDTRAQLLNNVFESSDSGLESLISAYGDSVVEIDNCTFFNIHSIAQGAVLTAGEKQAQVIFTDSIFMNTSAVEGSVFNVEYESSVR